MDQDIPIDIQTGKLVDWLVSRHHVKKTWPKAVQVIREKINNAIQDMPEHPEIIRLLSGSYINYFHCLQIIEILRETEKESKNMFGWYTSQRMKDWQEVVKLYEADNVYLAEASQYLIRNVNYDIPSIKRQIAKCSQVQEECSKKVDECVKGSTAAKNKYASSCKKIGITGDNIQEELVGLLNNLPEKLTEVGEKTKSLKKARQLYEDFVHFVGNPNASCLPLLGYFIDHGDTTIYEWKYGEAPISIEKPNSEILLNGESDDIRNQNNNPDEIDFGSDEVQLETGEIDWGNFDAGVDTVDIDYGNEIDGVDMTSQIIVESSGVDGGVARGEEAFSLLFTESTRNQFLNELMELQGFLSQRIIELEAEDSIISMNIFTNSPRSLQYQDVNTFTEYIHQISDIIKELTSTKIQHLYMISSSPRYVDRLSQTLKLHLAESDRLLNSVSGIKQKSEEASLQQHKLSQQLKLIISRSKELQENIEKDISKKYNNRIVNLMGGLQFI
ncbi:CDK5 regulatory subunit-associated protein 3 [Armadillidium nasatum]|uniref:CDK5 regulatory subunit-associated protein 3 n=1 Tax=Armadillidium nasatum TaxID=96803 RepID=A0A5N5T1L7_9CRUS|nr:CDK5 regulatory subunit-associated protein 3 [Armadillidium nasatum]